MLPPVLVTDFSTVSVAYVGWTAGGFWLKMKVENIGRKSCKR